MIPNIPKHSLYPSLATVGTSLNTAILPSIPLSRRGINDIEKHERRVPDSYVDGIYRGMNTSPVQSLDEQQDETMTTSKGQKPVVTQADLQEETLQPESLETEDTGMNSLTLHMYKPKMWKEMRYQLQKVPSNSRYKLPIQILRLMRNKR